jgi:hypothetical protein
MQFRFVYAGDEMEERKIGLQLKLGTRNKFAVITSLLFAMSHLQQVTSV